MGYDKNLLMESIQNKLQNEVTFLITYCWTGFLQVTTSGKLGAKCQEAMDSFSNIASYETPSSAHGNRQQIFMKTSVALRPHFPAERKWALGLQSRTHPREIMTEVAESSARIECFTRKRFVTIT